MKYILLVEGETERKCAPAFLKKWLDPKLSQPIGIDPFLLRGAGKFKKEYSRTAADYLDGPSQSEIVAVVGLLDLYGPIFYPSQITSANDRVDWAKKHFEDQFGRPDRFQMFFAVHEFEAWALSQPDIFPSQLRASIAKIAARPETVNFDEPPSKLLERLWMSRVGRRYDKVTDGTKLFDKLNPEVASKKCPRLKSMLETMLEMAKAAGL